MHKLNVKPRFLKLKIFSCFNASFMNILPTNARFNFNKRLFVVHISFYYDLESDLPKLAAHEHRQESFRLYTINTMCKNINRVLNLPYALMVIPNNYTTSGDDIIFATVV